VHVRREESKKRGRGDEEYVFNIERERERRECPR
jgi:hypothetical protein